MRNMIWQLCKTGIEPNIPEKCRGLHSAARREEVIIGSVEG